MYASARLRKLRPFAAFAKHAKVFVLTNQTLESRTRARELAFGKVVPEEAVNEMRANFALPTQLEGFDDIEFVDELTGPEAAAQVSCVQQQSTRCAAAVEGQMTHMLLARQLRYVRTYDTPHMPFNTWSCAGGARQSTRRGLACDTQEQEAKGCGSARASRLFFGTSCSSRTSSEISESLAVRFCPTAKLTRRSRPSTCRRYSLV